MTEEQVQTVPEPVAVIERVEPAVAATPDPGPQPTIQVNIYQEVLQLLTVETQFNPRHENESDPDYIKRIASKIAELSDTAWLKLSQQSQIWYNEVTDAINGMRPVPHPDGYVPVIPVPVSAATPETKSAEPAAKPKKAAAATDATPTSRELRKGAMARVRQVQIVNPKWDYVKVREVVQAEGFEITDSSAWTASEEVKRTLEAVEVLGLSVK